MFRLISIALLLLLVTNKATAGISLHPIWQFQQSGQSFYKTPIIHQDKVIFLSKNKQITAVAEDDGKVLWQKQHDDEIWGQSIHAGKEFVYYGSKNKEICAITLETGNAAWCSKLEKNMQRAPLEDRQRVYVVTAELGPELPGDRTKGGAIYALDKNSGKQLWRIDTNNYSMQSPIIKDNVLYVAGSYYDPKIDVEEGGPVSITAINTNNAQMKWRFTSEDGFIKSLYAHKNFLAFIGYQDFVSVLDTRSGELLWKKDTGNWVPAVSGFEDVIYYGSANTNVHAWNVANGADIWKHNIGGASFNYALGAPVRIGNYLAFLSQRGWLSILDAHTGNLLLQDQLGILSYIGLNASGETIIIGDSEGVVHAYRIDGLS